MDDEIFRETPGIFKHLLSDDESQISMNLLTEKVIGCAYNVSNALGCGFIEKVYENVLTIEMRSAGFQSFSSNRLRFLTKELSSVNSLRTLWLKAF